MSTQYNFDNFVNRDKTFQKHLNYTYQEQIYYILIIHGFGVKTNGGC